MFLQPCRSHHFFDTPLASCPEKFVQSPISPGASIMAPELLPIFPISDEVLPSAGNNGSSKSHTWRKSITYTPRKGWGFVIWTFVILKVELQTSFWAIRHSNPSSDVLFHYLGLVPEKVLPFSCFSKCLGMRAGFISHHFPSIWPFHLHNKHFTRPSQNRLCALGDLTMAFTFLSCSRCNFSYPLNILLIQHTFLKLQKDTLGVTERIESSICVRYRSGRSFKHLLSFLDSQCQESLFSEMIFELASYWCTPKLSHQHSFLQCRTFYHLIVFFKCEWPWNTMPLSSRTCCALYAPHACLNISFDNDIAIKALASLPVGQYFEIWCSWAMDCPERLPRLPKYIWNKFWHSNIEVEIYKFVIFKIPFFLIGQSLFRNNLFLSISYWCVAQKG